MFNSLKAVYNGSIVLVADGVLRCTCVCACADTFAQSMWKEF